MPRQSILATIRSIIESFVYCVHTALSGGKDLAPEAVLMFRCEYGYVPAEIQRTVFGRYERFDQSLRRTGEICELNPLVDENGEYVIHFRGLTYSSEEWTNLRATLASWGSDWCMFTPMEGCYLRQVDPWKGEPILAVIKRNPMVEECQT